MDAPASDDLWHRIAALEIENAKLRDVRDAFLRAAAMDIERDKRSAELEAENATSASTTFAALAPFVPAERIAENERLRAAFDRRYNEDDYIHTRNLCDIMNELSAAMEGKGDE